MSETRAEDSDEAQTKEPDEVLDVKGHSCPMPVVKTKQKIDDLDVDDILEVVATDSGSISDIEGWASGTDCVHLIDQVEDEDEGVYRHLIQRTDA